eukprot:m.230475 g.230475  ORF g.230475 m.230475 type:complete len:729 (+) comp16000_c0_seq5:147-2333(+)
MFPNPSKKNKESVAEKARKARAARAAAQKEKELGEKKIIAAALILRAVKRWDAATTVREIWKKHTETQLSAPNDSHQLVSETSESTKCDLADGHILMGASETDVEGDQGVLRLYLLTNKFLTVYRLGGGKLEDQDYQQLVALLQEILSSMVSQYTDMSYVAVALKPSHTIPFIRQLKTLIVVIGKGLQCATKSGMFADALVFLNGLFRLSDSSTWRLYTGDTPKDKLGRKALATMCASVGKEFLANSGIQCICELLSKVIQQERCPEKTKIVNLGVTLCIRLIGGQKGILDYGPSEWTQMSTSILAVPTLISLIFAKKSDISEFFVRQKVGLLIFKYLLSNPDVEFLDNMKPNDILFFLGNFLTLIMLEFSSFADEEIDNICILVRQISIKCQSADYDKGNSSFSHPVFGWSIEKVERDLSLLLSSVIEQVRVLWSYRVISRLFMPAKVILGQKVSQEQDKTKHKPKKRSFGFSLFKGSQNRIKTDGLTAMRMASVCHMYLSLIAVFPELQSEIISTLAYFDELVGSLWSFLPTLGPKGNMEVFLAAAMKPEVEPLIDILALACLTATRLILILDDEEIYEQEYPLSISMLREISDFLNKFIFKALWNRKEPTDPFQAQKQSRINHRDRDLYRSAAQLLRVLYDKDARRPFTPESFWITRAISTKEFQSELGKEQNQSAPIFKRAFCILERLPQVLPYMFRCSFFTLRWLKRSLNLNNNNTGLKQSLT